MKNVVRRILSIILVLAFVFSLSSCGVDYEIPNKDDFSVMENAEIIGELKGQVAVKGTFIEIRFPEAVTFDTVVIEEKGNQIDKFSIWLEDENGEYRSVLIPSPRFI